MINVHKNCEWYDQCKDGCTNYFMVCTGLSYKISEKIPAICIKYLLDTGCTDE